MEELIKWVGPINLKIENINLLNKDINKEDEFDKKTLNINSSDYIDTNRQMIEAHELGHIAGAAVNEGTSRPGIMSSREQDIFKSSMLPLREPTLSGPQGSQQREASRRSLEDFIHSQKPQEVKADLDALRFSMYDKGIYDIRKGTKFSDLDFENARQKLGKDRVFKRLENRVGKKNFVNCSIWKCLVIPSYQTEKDIVFFGILFFSLYKIYDLKGR